MQHDTGRTNVYSEIEGDRIMLSEQRCASVTLPDVVAESNERLVQGKMIDYSTLAAAYRRRTNRKQERNATVPHKRKMMRELMKLYVKKIDVVANP